MRHTRLTSLPSRMAARALCLLLLILSGGVAHGQNAPSPTATAEALTSEQVQARIDAATGAASLAEDVKSRTVDLYNQTLEQLRLAKEWVDMGAAHEKAVQDAPALMTQAESELSRAAEKRPPELPKEATLLDLEQRAAQAEADLGAAKATLEERQKEPARRAERAKQLPELISAAAGRLGEARVQLDSPAPPDEPAEVGAARNALNRARVQAAQAEKDAYEKEMARYRSDSGLLLLQQDAAAARVSELERQVRQWRDIVAARREEELQQAVQEAQQSLLETAQAGPAVRAYAEQLATQNKELLSRRTGTDGIVRKIDDAQTTLDQLDRQLAGVRASLEDVRAKTETVGPGVALGLLLRNTLAGLPDARKLREHIRERGQEIARVQLEQFELPEQRAALATRERDLQTETPEADETQLRILRDLLGRQRSYLNDLVNDNSRYLNALLDAQMREQQLVAATRELSAYIHERILWVKSTHLYQLSDVTATCRGLLWLGSPQNWAEVGTALTNEALLNTPRHLLMLALIAVLFWLSLRSARRLDALGEEAKRHLSLFLAPTLVALLLTLAMAVPWPALLWLAGWELSSMDSAFVQSLGNGLSSAAFVCLLFEFALCMVRVKGLADAHFDWPSSVLKTLRRHLPWLMAVSLICVFVISFLEDYGDDAKISSLGRTFFFAATAGYAAFSHLVYRRGGAIGSTSRLFHNRRGEYARLLAHIANSGVPLTLAALAAFGYYYTALRLTWRVFDTAALLLALLLARSLVLRALRLARKRHRQEQQAKAATEAQGDAPTAQSDEEEEIDWSGIDSQTKHVVASGMVVALMVGIWIIWADVLPALGVLNRVELWQTTQSVTETTKDAAGTLVRSSHEKVAPITLAHVCLALLLLFMTFVMSRNLPSLIEVAVLRHLPLIAGERYAITTVTRYAIVILGLVSAFHAIGLGWGKVQWLIAAMGVGLGFGLQEIFANFISGLIILFERPIRLGDTVTIGGISGTVTQIRMRATRIMDWDRKELIVPNKEFVTGQLVNWTLSDPMLRVIIPVGIAYGSDTQQAVRTLERVARAHPLVMEEPAPQVLFMKFGASSLDFELRVYCPGVEHLLAVRHDLHMAIDRAFREAGIQIAFPQQDIHLRSVEADFPITIRGKDETR